MKKITKTKVCLLLACMAFNVSIFANDMITFMWQAQATQSKTFTLDIIYWEVPNYSFTINWGDGSSEIVNVTFDKYGNPIYPRPFPIDHTHTYNTAGVYTVVITASTADRFETFVCTNAQMSSLEVSSCKKLKQLICSQNQLTTLDVSENIELYSFSCNNNQLSSINVSGATALQHFGCSANQLQTLDVSTNANLEYFYCFENQLTSLDVSSNSKLKQLWCYSNQLSTLDVSTNTQLSNLNCMGNQLTTLDISQNTALKTLDCHLNNLSLSELFVIYGYLQSNEANMSTCRFASQRLPAITVNVGETLFATQAVFNSIFTTYTVVRNPISAKPVNYTVIDGKLIFNEAGSFTVFMTNAAMITNSVAIDITVKEDCAYTASLNTALNQQIANLQSQLNAANNTISNLETEILTLNGQIIILQQELENCGSSDLRTATTNALSVYPNPTTSIVHLSQETEIKVFTQQGVLLQETFGAQVDLSAYPQGIYLLQINNQIVKIVKQ